MCPLRSVMTYFLAEGVLRVWWTEQGSKTRLLSRQKHILIEM